MDEATLTIKFRDESSPGAGGAAATAPQGGGRQPNLAAEQQSVITQAGGVGAMAAKNNQTSGQVPSVSPAAVPPAGALPVPPIGAVGGDPLLKTAQGIVAADPTVTIAELQKALGVPAARAQQLFSAATVAPGGQQAPAPTAALPVPTIAPTPASFQPGGVAQPPPAPPGLMPPPVPPPTAAEYAQQVKPPPVINPPPSPPAAGQPANVQAAVNAIAGIAAQGGPLGAAAGQAARAAAAIPGVGAGLAAAAPGLAAAAPYIAAGAAALAVPAAGALAINSIAQTARGQIQGLSPEVAAAEAEANVRQLVANLRTAGQLGDELGERITRRSRISANLQETRDLLVEPLLQKQNDFLAAIEVFTKAIKGAAKVTRSQYDQAVGEGTVAGGFLSAPFLPFKALSEAVAGGGAGLTKIIPTRPKLPPPFADNSPHAPPGVKRAIEEMFRTPGL